MLSNHAFFFVLSGKFTWNLFGDDRVQYSNWNLKTGEPNQDGDEDCAEMRMRWKIELIFLTF